jgi:hypothetical protein
MASTSKAMSHEFCFILQLPRVYVRCDKSGIAMSISRSTDGCPSRCPIAQTGPKLPHTTSNLAPSDRSPMNGARRSACPCSRPILSGQRRPIGLLAYTWCMRYLCMRDKCWSFVALVALVFCSRCLVIICFGLFTRVVVWLVLA